MLLVKGCFLLKSWSFHPSFATIVKARRGIAQLVEHWSPKPGVVGSSPATPANKSDTSSLMCLFYFSLWHQRIHSLSWEFAPETGFRIFQITIKW